MSKSILITGSTDGIGFETAKLLLEQGHRVLLHGRNPQKLEEVTAKLSPFGQVKGYVADLSDLSAVKALADNLSADLDKMDVLINNAGILKTDKPVTIDGLDIRIAVNTIAPYILTKQLLRLMGDKGRVVNIASAAQAPVDFNMFAGKGAMANAMEAYSQSKLAIIMWSNAMAKSVGSNGPMIVSVNPGSLLASKMVKQGFGIAGNDLSIGAEILTRAAISDEFSDAAGKYFDNDSGHFSNPHPDALDHVKCEKVIEAMEEFLNR